MLSSPNDESPANIDAAVSPITCFICGEIACGFYWAHGASGSKHCPYVEWSSKVAQAA